jgi:hypothetical protein
MMHRPGASLGNSVWQNEFNLTARQFNLAKRIQFDNSAIQFGKTNSIRQFDLAFGRSACMFGLKIVCILSYMYYE